MRCRRVPGETARIRQMAIRRRRQSPPRSFGITLLALALALLFTSARNHDPDPVEAAWSAQSYPHLGCPERVGRCNRVSCSTPRSADTATIRTWASSRGSGASRHFAEWHTQESMRAHRAVAADCDILHIRFINPEQARTPMAGYTLHSAPTDTKLRATAVSFDLPRPVAYGIHVQRSWRASA